MSTEQSATTKCGRCYTCLDQPELGMLNPAHMRMILCPICGNKRCSHATDHKLPCLHSNEPGQPGSRYPDTWGEADREVARRMLAAEKGPQYVSTLPTPKASSLSEIFAGKWVTVLLVNGMDISGVFETEGDWYIVLDVQIEGENHEDDMIEVIRKDQILRIFARRDGQRSAKGT